MSEAFDPYLKWLGIPAKDRPADFYRLLGIERFEADPDVIANAADQRMAHVRNFGAGNHAADSQRILNEIAAARVCLLNEEKKARYDAALRERLRQRPSPGEKSKLVVAEALPSPEPESETSFLDQLTQAPRVPAASPRPSAGRARPKKKSNPWPLIAGVAVAGPLLLILILLSIPESKPGPQTADKRETTPELPRPTTEKAQKSLTEKGDSNFPAPRRNKPVPAGVGSVAKPTAGDEVKGATERSPAPPDTSRLPVRPGMPKRPKLDLQDSEDGSEPSPSEPSPEDAPPPRPTQPKTPPDKQTSGPSQKLAEPAGEALKKAEKEVREVYQENLTKVQSPEQRLALAEEMQRGSQNGADKPAVRYVLLQLASQQAAEAGNLDRAMALLDELAQAFQTNVLPRKAELLASHAEAILKPRGTHSVAERQRANEQVLEAARALTKAAIDAGDFDTANRCLKIALPAARVAKDARLVTTIQATLKEVTKVLERQRSVLEAETTLKAAPDDPHANAVAGAWYCLVVGDFGKGLPCLAKGEDADLAALAQQDLAAPRETLSQSKVGDLWWEWGEKKSWPEKTRAQARAAHWYKLALPGATGLVKTKVQKRLDSLGGGKGRFALRFDGQGSYVVVPNALYNGAVPITLEVFAKPDRTTRSTTSSYSSQALVANGSYSGLSLGTSYDGWYFHFRCRSGAGMSGYPSTEQLTSERNANGMDGFARNPLPEKWTHVAAVYDGRQMKLFVDGQLQGTRVLSGEHVPSVQPFVIGACPSHSSGDNLRGFFRGLIRMVRVSKSAVYTQNFQPPTEFPPSLSTVLLFTFSEGQGEQLKDSSGKNLVGVIRGAEWVELEEADRAGPAAPLREPAE